MCLVSVFSVEVLTYDKILCRLLAVWYLWEGGRGCAGRGLSLNDVTECGEQIVSLRFKCASFEWGDGGIEKKGQYS